MALAAVFNLVTSLVGALYSSFSLSLVAELFTLYIGYLFLSFLWGRFSAPKKGRPVPFQCSSETFGSGREIPLINPATMENMGTAHAYTDEEVSECVRRAREAQKEWEKTSFAERKAVLHDLMASVIKNQDKIISASSKDTGKTEMEAMYGEILTTCEKLRYLASYGEDALKTSSRYVPLLLRFVKKAWVEYYPMGVIGIIVPWNYPFHNVISAVSSAIMAGNAAVVKVSEHASYSKDCFEGLLREVLANRGHNPELITLLAGYGDTGAALIQSGVDKVLFIGSPRVGKLVMKAASDSLTPVILELGGKDPFIVFQDAEIDQAVDVATRAVFINCGQNCIAAERIYVQESIYDEFVDKVTRVVNQMRQGPPQGAVVDSGAMTMPAQVDIVERLVNNAVDQGATVVAGGCRNEEYDGLFFKPTVLTNLNHHMDIVKEEVFGPVMLILPFSDEADVIQKANSTVYALACSIFTTDYARAHRVAKQVVSGMCTINDFGLSYLVQSLPFGGAKVSGFGRFNGPEGLREFCRVKSVVSDRFPMRTKAPRFTQYPIPDNALGTVSAAVGTIYGGSLLHRISSLARLVKVSLGM